MDHDVFLAEEERARWPVPFCCPAIAGARVLRRSGSSVLGVPRWQCEVIRAPRAETFCVRQFAHVSHCPLCGTKLPPLVTNLSLRSPWGDPDLWVVDGAPPVFAAVVLLQRVGPRGSNFLSVSRKGRPSELGLPGGRVELLESPEDSARRELLEETGLVVGRMRKVFDAMDDAGVRVVCLRAESARKVSEPDSFRETGTVSWVTMDALRSSSPFASYNTALFTALGYHRPAEVLSVVP